MCNIPYTSSGVAASAVGMDKVYMKQYFVGGGFPVLPSCWYLRLTWENTPETVLDGIEKALSYPVFVKPAMLGSSIGVSKAKDRDSLKAALELAFEFDRKVLVEKGLENPLELNCSVLGYGDEAQPSEIEMPVTGGDLLSFSGQVYSGQQFHKGDGFAKACVARADRAGTARADPKAVRGYFQKYGLQRRRPYRLYV